MREAMRGNVTILAAMVLPLLLGGLVSIASGVAALALVVPAAANAGDLGLKPYCDDSGKGESKTDCGSLLVPENRKNATARLSALPD